MADELRSGQGRRANKADEAKVAKANVANKAVKANETNKIDEIFMTNEANVINKITVANPIWFCPCLYSLTKCSAFFSKDEGYFGIWLVARSQDELDKLVVAKGANNNQL